MDRTRMYTRYQQQGKFTLNLFFEPVRDLMYKSASYTGISTRKLLVVRSTLKAVKLLFFGNSMIFYGSSFCSSFLLVLVNLVNARSKDRK